MLLGADFAAALKALMTKPSCVFLPLLPLLLLSCGESAELFHVASSDPICLNMTYGSSGTPVTLCHILATSDSSPTGEQCIRGADFEMKNGDRSATGIGVSLKEHYTATLTGYHLDSHFDRFRFSLKANSETDFYVCFEGTFSQEGTSIFYRGNEI